MAPLERQQQLEFEQIGEGERLVLVHGFSQSRRSMLGLARLLAPYFEVVTVDLPFHGSSPRPATSIEHAATMLGESCGEASYLGYSLGGRICLALALHQPDLVRRLVLVGATPGIASADARALRRTEDEALASRLDPSGSASLSLEDFFSTWLAGPLFSHLTEEQADLAARRVNTPAQLAEALRCLGTGTQRPSHDRLGELAMPVLLVAGANDAKFAEIAKEMQARIGPNASCELIAGSGHAVPFERTRPLADLLRRFLAGGP